MPGKASEGTVRRVSVSSDRCRRYRKTSISLGDLVLDMCSSNEPDLRNAISSTMVGSMLGSLNCIFRLDVFTVVAVAIDRAVRTVDVETVVAVVVDRSDFNGEKHKFPFGSLALLP